MVANFDAVTSHNAAGEDDDGRDDTIFVGERMEKYPSFPPEKKANHVGGPCSFFFVHYTIFHSAFLKHIGNQNIFPSH